MAGKTGTAELTDTTTPSTNPNAPPPSSPQNTDAWFVGYGPVGKPRIVVAVPSGITGVEQRAFGDAA